MTTLSATTTAAAFHRGRRLRRTTALRGLVRELMDWAHRLSAARGHVVQVMIGIPYFYRLFGYEYAIDIPPARVLAYHKPAGEVVTNDIAPRPPGCRGGGIRGQCRSDGAGACQRR